MGDWNTLHLFDDQRFYHQTVPALQGHNGDLTEHYKHYSSTFTGGRCTTTLETLISISAQMENGFREFPAFQEAYLQHLDTFLSTHAWVYDFALFFEMMVFSASADFLPNMGLGKRDLSHWLPDMPLGKEAAHILGELGKMNYSSVFCADGAGVMGWITAAEVSLLLADIKKVIAGQHALPQDELEAVQNFATFLSVAEGLNKGILSGVNLRGQYWEQLSQFRLSRPADWEGQQIEALFLR